MNLNYDLYHNYIILNGLSLKKYFEIETSLYNIEECYHVSGKIWFCSFFKKNRYLLHRETDIPSYILFNKWVLYYQYGEIFRFESLPYKIII